VVAPAVEAAPSRGDVVAAEADKAPSDSAVTTSHMLCCISDWYDRRASGGRFARPVFAPFTLATGRSPALLVQFLVDLPRVLDPALCVVVVRTEARVLVRLDDKVRLVRIKDMLRNMLTKVIFSCLREELPHFFVRSQLDVSGVAFAMGGGVLTRTNRASPTGDPCCLVGIVTMRANAHTASLERRCARAFLRLESMAADARQAVGSWRLGVLILHIFHIRRGLRIVSPKLDNFGN